MTNREKLLKMNIYDVLCDMNEKLAFLDIDEYPCCVIQIFDTGRDCLNIINNHTYRQCGECIANWLNEEAK